jgi:hypothetical protein
MFSSHFRDADYLEAGIKRIQACGQCHDVSFVYRSVWGCLRAIIDFTNTTIPYIYRRRQKKSQGPVYCPTIIQLLHKDIPTKFPTKLSTCIAEALPCPQSAPLAPYSHLDHHRLETSRVILYLSKIYREPAVVVRAQAWEG